MFWTKSRHYQIVSVYNIYCFASLPTHGPALGAQGGVPAGCVRRAVLDRLLLFSALGACALSRPVGWRPRPVAFLAQVVGVADAFPISITPVRRLS